MKKLTLIVLCSTLFGCAAWTPFHKISLGMTKAEVLQAVGKPASVSGNGTEEYLWYIPVNKFWQRYFVRLEKGRVESYGPVGDKTAPR
jgi:hypothetical protein